MISSQSALPGIRARQRPVMRGASTRGQAKTRRVNWSFLKSGMLGVAVVLVVAGAGAAAREMLSVGVSRVVVSGEFKQVDKQMISEQIQPYLNNGFLRLDLAAIQDHLRQQPWVYSATISRRWPNEIEVNVEEQTPIARWGKRGYLNHRGELFVPESTNRRWINTSQMPQLAGPDDSSAEVMDHYRELSEMLSEYGLTLTELKLDEQSGWYMRLQMGTEIRLGSGEVMEKMRRFLSVYRLSLSKQFNKVSAVDMRYSSGFAVAWKAQPSEG